MRLCVLLAGLVVMTGCATGAPLGGRVLASSYRYSPLTPAAAPRAPLSEVASSSAPRKQVRPPPPAARRQDVLTVARELVGSRRVKLAGRTWPDDCTGFVEAVYAQAGVSFRGEGLSGDNGVTALYRYAKAHGRVYTRGQPRPGDLVFFRETYDQNRDGRRNDGLTHVGLVDGIEDDGTVVVIHRVKRGVVRYRMNLAKPGLQRDPRTGEVLNDMLRAPGAGKAPVLTGQLFAAFGSVLPEPSPTAVARR
ncbi:C40 family peptidase [Archangium violaceum]|uniref:CHAP domain-containing protein n=1 Tax=Archangium violaceum TaxID=83451 RepID=UPI001950EB00|nr:CHAP domain-containing protein [Archangium violaceum]QRO01802.1 C40 family peptidase [Archangium violaceum]